MARRKPSLVTLNVDLVNPKSMTEMNDIYVKFEYQSELKLSSENKFLGGRKDR